MLESEGRLLLSSLILGIKRLPELRAVGRIFCGEPGRELRGELGSLCAAANPAVGGGEWPDVPLETRPFGERGGKGRCIDIATESRGR